MSDKKNGCSTVISDCFQKVSRVYLLCSNPVSQQNFDIVSFPPKCWIKPSLVAADGTVLAFYSEVENRWLPTRAKVSFINESAKPPSNFLEIHDSLRFALTFAY